MVSDKTIAIVTSSSSPSPSLPIPEILGRLLVKSLLQFRCVCKSWNSLISDRKFAKKHLSLSTTRTLHCISNSDNEHVLINSYSLDSVFTNITQTLYPSPSNVLFVGSCHGILCLVNDSLPLDDVFVLQLWNPSIRKFKELPHLINEEPKYLSMYGFIYDPISDNYKVVVVFGDVTHDDLSEDELINEVTHEVKVHTLGIDPWKNVLEFPFPIFSYHPMGQHVSGTINWLIFAGIKILIASFDLRNECFRDVLLPDDSSKVDKSKLYLSVFRDCLCMISGEDVWMMKEYGNKESWTKLDPRALSYPYIKGICVFEDEQVRLIYKRCGYISYDRKNDTSKLIEFESLPEVCVESLISPCF